MAGIFRTSAYTGTETVVFRTDFNTGHTKPVSAIPGDIPGFGGKLDTRLEKKKKVPFNTQ